ncbi:LytR/AlgR family response regulator transcription factor [Anaerovorax odorimutans]|uniref:LytR/AlgR family response regulator transcription factor n=1 Tax=Anaerovorax odorimutans TaxID=109327 RepID=UPI0003F5BED3|nr:LytTR family DNA-binding domain-containing protein [Anaerovorax odorimutans]
MRVILIDDELPALDELSYQLNNFDDVNVIAQFTDPLVALKEVEMMEPDVVFIDIDMPILNGLSFAVEILEHNENLLIIFVTAYNNYALQAFEVNAIDYIVKPVRLSRLTQTVEKLRKMLENNFQTKERLFNQLTDLKKIMNKTSDRLVVFDGENYHFINFNEILYVEAMTKFVAVVTAEGDYTTKKTMKEMDERLRSRGFFRCHRSYIINPTHITEIMPTSSGTFNIKLNYSAIIPVSKSHIMEVKELIGNM